ncbi:DUF4350 domain-containing protein, partial [Flavobacterium sp.]|uniref:DUF4350 domain-containing protein n=1 Tax=Flavobacterium sp. TaxID=239 RepID=UPI00374DC4C9
PRPIDWTPSYDLNDKIPFGLYVFDNESKTLLKNDTIKKVTTTPYEYFENIYDYDTLVKTYKENGTILSISEYYMIDDESTDELFYFVGHGNSAFISTKDFSQKFRDSLGFEIVSEFEMNQDIQLSLANKKLNAKSYSFNIGASSSSFNKIDNSKTTVLGFQEVKKEKKINFIKIAYKSGFFYLHTQPAAFTNYHLLKENHSEYTEKIVSYIPEGTVFWLVKDLNGNAISDSPMRYWLSQPALKWAWYLFALGALVFMIFNAKRRQRIIPIIKPLPNTTVDFTKTIGNLYYQEGDHQNIIDKKIIYFLEKIRHDYLIDTTILDENFIKKLHSKTGKNSQDIEKIVRLINYHKKSYNQSIEQDLIEINNAIEKIIN